MTAKISIVTATYNRLAFLKEAMASVQAQTYPHWEHIIVNDGSDDGTREFLDSCARTNAQLHVIHQAHRGHYAYSLNRALHHATGEYFFKLDDDDLADAQYLETCIHSLQNKDDSYFAVRTRGHYQTLHKKSVFAQTDGIYELEPLFFRTATLRQLNGWNEFYRRIEDSELNIRALDLGYKLVDIAAPLYTYRQISPTSLFRSPETLAWRFVLFNIRKMRQRWGLADLTRQNTRLEQVLDTLWGRKPCLPYVCGKLIAASAYLDTKIMTHSSYWNVFAKSLYALGAATPAFPYAPLWRELRLLWRLMRPARFPFWVQWHAFCQISRLYFPSKSKQYHWEAHWQRLFARQRPAPAKRNPSIAIGFVVQRNLADLRAMLAQLQKQTHKNWELFLVDSGASGPAGRLAKHAARQDTRIHWLAPQIRLTPVDALRYAFRVMRAPRLYRWDSRNTISPTHLKDIVKFMRKNEAILIAGTGAACAISKRAPIFWQPIRLPCLKTTLWTIADMQLQSHASHLQIFGYLPGVAPSKFSGVVRNIQKHFHHIHIFIQAFERRTIKNLKQQYQHILGPLYHFHGRATYFPYCVVHGAQYGITQRWKRPQHRYQLRFKPYWLLMQLYWHVVLRTLGLPIRA